MRNYNFTIFLFFALIAVLVLRYNYTQKKEMESHPMTSELAIEPDRMILNAQHYLKEHQRNTSINFIGKAIKAMQLVEKDADSLSNIAIDEAIEDLKSVEEELKNKTVNRQHISQSFFNALNSLALAQVRISEYYQKTGETNISHLSLEYAIHHLKNAIQFVKGPERKKEIEIYNKLDSLLEAPTINNEQIIAELDLIIEEFDKLINQPE